MAAQAASVKMIPKIFMVLRAEFKIAQAGWLWGGTPSY